MSEMFKSRLNSIIASTHMPYFFFWHLSGTAISLKQLFWKSIFQKFEGIQL